MDWVLALGLSALSPFASWRVYWRCRQRGWLGRRIVDEAQVIALNEPEMWALLDKTPMGRLAVAAAGELDIFPVNYIVDDGSLLFRTAAGTKLVELTVNAMVAFEIDGYDDTTAWSVVVKGSAARLDHQAEIDRADTLPLTPWIPTLKYTYVRVKPTSLSGRSFRVGPEPDRYDV